MDQSKETKLIESINEIIKSIDDGEIKVQLDPGAIRTGNTYSVGCVGAMGCTGMPTCPCPSHMNTLPKRIYKTPVSCILRFSYTGKDAERFLKLAIPFEYVRDHDDVHIGYFNKIPKNIFNRRFDPEYSNRKEQIDELHKDTIKRYNELVEELSELGVHTCELEPPIVVYPKEFFIHEESVDYDSVRIDIFCDRQSKIYNMFDAVGLIEKSVPDWYRNLF